MRTSKNRQTTRPSWARLWKRAVLSIALLAGGIIGSSVTQAEAEVVDSELKVDCRASSGEFITSRQHQSGQGLSSAYGCNEPIELWQAKGAPPFPSTNPPTVNLDRSNLLGKVQLNTRQPNFSESDANVLRLYWAFFNRDPDLKGSLYWLDLSRSGVGLDQIAYQFAVSQEFQNRYGQVSHSEFLLIVYRNVLGREPDQRGFNYWLGVMQSGLSRGEVVRWIAANDEFIRAHPYENVAATTTLDPASDEWNYWELDGDECFDMATMDSDRNGFNEEIWLDANNDCAWDAHMSNTLGADDFLESLTFDLDKDGRWEVFFLDTDQQPGYEIAYFDDDGDGIYDRWSDQGAATLSQTLTNLTVSSLLDIGVLVNGCAAFCRPTLVF